jgi:hypothetical protein
MNSKNDIMLNVLMVIVLILIFLVPILFYTGGCSQILAKNYGGTMEVKLEPNRRLVNATWKDSDLWILTVERKKGEEAQIYKFEERSTCGLLQGTVNIKEQ